MFIFIIVLLIIALNCKSALPKGRKMRKRVRHGYNTLFQVLIFTFPRRLPHFMLLILVDVMIV